MKYVSAYMLATLGGIEQPCVDDIKKILSAAGIEIDEERVEKLIASLSGKKVEEVIASGMSKLASMPSGGASVPAGASAASAAAPPAAKEEAKKEIKEESDDDMGMGLFD